MKNKAVWLIAILLLGITIIVFIMSHAHIPERKVSSVPLPTLTPTPTSLEIVRSRSFMPVSSTNPPSLKKCVAHAAPNHILAYQLSNELNVSCGHTWGYDSRKIWEGVLLYYHMVWSDTGIDRLRLFVPTDSLENGGGCSGAVVFFLNEPNNPDPLAAKELTPREAADAYIEVRQRWSCIRLVGPMVLNYWQGGSSSADFGIPYLLDFGNEVRASTGEWPDVEMSLHFYHGWPEAASIIMDRLCNEVAMVWDVPCTFWVTEYGTCSPVQMEALTNFFNQDSRVVRYFVFSPIWHDCTTLYDTSTLELTSLGKAFARSGNETQEK